MTPDQLLERLDVLLAKERRLEALLQRLWLILEPERPPLRVVERD